MAYKSTGGATTSLFRIFTISSDHTTIGGTVALDIEAVVKTSRSGTGVSVDHIKSDTGIWDFINTYASATEASDDGDDYESVILDDETTDEFSGSGSASSSQNFLCISVGGTNADGIKTQAFLVTLNNESGAHDQEAKKFDRPALQFDAVKAKTDVTIATGQLGATYNASATFDILTGKWVATDFLAAA